MVRSREGEGVEEEGGGRGRGRGERREVEKRMRGGEEYGVGRLGRRECVSHTLKVYSRKH